MSRALLETFKLHLSPGASLAPLLSGQSGPFWQVVPHDSAADYADGLEELIAEFNELPAAEIPAWAAAHPLTPEQRYVLFYNISPDRSNVLGPLAFAPTDQILEVGCGCGPISQHLWSQARTLSLDASAVRATVAARRLAHHSNPYQSALLNADFHQLAGAGSFDWVILVGVLEYAAIYSGTRSDSPYVAMLEKVRDFLKPGGRCVVAIENRLGLKYFAGATEDHFGRTGVGLEGYHALSTPARIKTFSRPALEQLLATVGLSRTAFYFPFPDYKFANVAVPDDRASWQFATERLIGPAPAIRQARTFAFNEPAAFRSLADDGIAGEFAHSFVAVAVKPGAEPAPSLDSLLRYFPVGRNTSTKVNLTFDLSRGQVARHHAANHDLPALPEIGAAVVNPFARFDFPQLSSDRKSSRQTVSPRPSLWESLRSHLVAPAENPDDYRAALQTVAQTTHARFLRSLPHAAEGNWPQFIEQLDRMFDPATPVYTAARPVIEFLRSQQSFAEQSLRSCRQPTWCIWAPDWIMENLFPAEGNDAVVLFDVEYVEPAARLPSPVLAYRQLQLLQTKLSQGGYVNYWPWESRWLRLGSIEVRLPKPLGDDTGLAFWSLPRADLAAHEWFWSKVGEIVECAFTSRAVHPFHLAYETLPWVERLARELSPLSGQTLAVSEFTPGLEQSGRRADVDVELITKEQEVTRLKIATDVLDRQLHDKEASLLESQRLAENLNQQVAAKEQMIRDLKQGCVDRDALVQVLAAERDTLQARLAGAGPVTADASGKANGRLEQLEAELARQTRESMEKEIAIQDLTRACRERDNLIQQIADSPRGRRIVVQRPTFLGRQFDRIYQKALAYAAERSVHPLGELKQHEPRPPTPERLPVRPPRSDWPRICIITPSYQQARFLERTMRSVLDQHYPKLAYGVQDGGSTDGSAELITRYVPQLAHAESARDNGQAAAIQRGFEKLYPGDDDIMAWLNSDDVLNPGSLALVGDYFRRHPDVDVVYGHRTVIDEEDREIGRWFLPPHHDHTLPWFDMIPQETLFWRARCYREVGGIDPSFQFAMDWDLLLRFEQAGFTFKRLPYFLGRFRVHTTQKTSAKIVTVGEAEMKQLRLRTHRREVPTWEILKHLNAEIRRSALTAWTHQHGLRF